MIEFLKDEISGDSKETLGALLVLLAFALVAAYYVLTDGLEKEKADKLIDVKASDLYVWKIRITSAHFGAANNTIDIVNDMNDLVQQYGQTWVRIPGREEWKNHKWFDKDPAKDVPLENKSIAIKYEVYRVVYDPNAESEDKIYPEIMTTSSATVTNTSVFLRAEPSIFDNVVEISSLTLDTKSGYSFPGAFLSEVCRNSHICENWYQVERPKKSLKSGAYPCPASSSFPVSSYSVSFWVYLKKPKSSDGQRNILYKGDLSNGISPQIILEAGSNVLIARATCKRSDRGENYVLQVRSEDLSPKHWYHVALSIDQLSLKLYIDSHLVEKKLIDGSVVFNPSPIYLGDLPPGVCPEPIPAGFNGTTFDVRFYTRAIREEEINAYWQNTTVRDKSNEKTEINLPSTEYEPLTTKDLQNAWTGSTCWGSKSWTSEVDQQLMDLIEEATNEYCTELMQADFGEQYEISGTTLFTATAHNLEPSKKIIDGYQLITHQRLKTMRTRFLMISMLNNKIDRVLPLVDFSQATQLNSLSWRICRLRSLIFMELKNKAWKGILNETSSRSGGLRIELNRPKALKARETRSDPSGKKSVFGQMFCQLHFRKPERLRTDIRPDHRPWSVSFSGEGAQDVGGPFRESLSVLSDDLQSDHLQLFIKCANSSGYGNNQEKFIPNPSCESSLQLAMYSCVGKIMGVAFRGKYYLNLDFASVIWKPLVGEKITRKDLQDIDQLFITQIEQFSEGTSKEHINSLEQKFVILSADGREVELKQGGKHIEVTCENKHEYVDLACEYKLNEFEIQVQAIRKGLGTIIPIQLLPMFTWQQLERLVCGKREIDVNLLRANTDYSRCRRDDKHIKFFWKALEEMSHTQRQQFLRFVWGQSRLPTEQHWRHRFRIQDYQGGSDQTLPISHTCFFSLELPRYSTFEALKKKLLYACANCEAIDTDFNADNIDWNE